MQIREFRPDDAAALAQIFHAAVHGIGARDYSPEQLKAWSPEPAPAEVWSSRAADGRHVFVAADAGNQPQAFIELEMDGHIDCFYCHPQVAGTGTGAALYERLEAEARSLGLRSLYVEASEAARRFFLRQGFTIETRREIERRGVVLHNYRMTKTLAG
ncbi:GNAT family N-acetyltransferase [Leisingera aquaemixtae]|uniref:GNAT family N-acetyltransferase n=1 Tax=Leisingera aquaemixtae TaxID=1396826 RepID=UPI001C94A7CF|nr:GNAT family N-acetyltransferase [Leisingera aquaemixtae]MBY6066987.1 GNAT family N-acetyltransferase [Leisingera aquaemixtae]